MSQYSHLSTPDPEFAAILAQLPQESTPWDDVLLMQEGMKQAVCAHNEHLQPRLPLKSEYRVSDHKVPVEDGEIMVRCLVPSSAKEEKTFAVLVWFHGGGWLLGDLDMDDYRLRMLCVELQISIVNVDYRLAPEHVYPVGWNDAYIATKWGTEHTALLSASLDKGFIVGGCSAGANLAATVVYRTRDDTFFAETPITGQLLQVPCLLHPESQTERFKSELLSMEQNKDVPSFMRAEMIYLACQLKIPKSDLAFSMVLQPSHTGLPPLYMQITGWDPLRDEGLLYAKLLEQAGVKTKVDIYPGLPHGFNFTYPQLQASLKLENDVETGIKWLLSLK